MQTYLMYISSSQKDELQRWNLHIFNLGTEVRDQHVGETLVFQDQVILTTVQSE